MQKKLLNNNEDYPVCFAAYSNDPDRVMSSSGGIFAELSKKVLEDSGIVFGATIASDGKVSHTSVNSRNELYKLLGSKYVQSDIGTSYSEVKKYLKEKKLVLFCGTPCQNEGLLSFLGEKPDNLILIDFICHGVPSFKVFREYLNEISNSREIESISFRNKEKGWLDYSFRIDFKNRESFCSIYSKNTYMNGFLSDLFLRPSCYTCRFKGIRRKTDITLGDFWGILDEEPDFYEKNGVSVLILHNERACNLLSEINDRIVSKKIEITKVIKHNPSLVRSSDMNIMRNLFFLSMKSGIRNAINGILTPNLFQKVRNKIYRFAYKIFHAIKNKFCCIKNTLSQKFKFERKGTKAPVIFNSKSDCCGCYACFNICPKGAISMHEDVEGFYYPAINKELCVGCNRCISICPVRIKDLSLQDE